MSLIEKLFDATQPDKNIIIAETQQSEDYEEKRQRVEEGFRTIFGRTTRVDVVQQNMVGLFDDLENSVLFLNSTDGSFLPEPEKISSTIKLAHSLHKEHPNSKIAVMINHYDAKPMRIVFDLILPYFAGTEIYNKTKPFLETMEGSKSVLEYLDSRMGSIRHSIGNLQNAAFREWLAKRYQDGNLQSNIQESFLVVSGRMKKESKGIFHVISPEELDSTDFTKYLAFFVDNEGDGSNQARLGSGIKTLERISELGLDIPIFYETAHLLDNFTSDDISRVTSHKNTLMIQKNLAPKISRTKTMAERELLIGDLVGQDYNLSKYCVRQIRVGKEGYVEVKNGFLTFTKSAPKTFEKDFYRRVIFGRTGLPESDLNHKLYVLSLFHSRLKYFTFEETLAPDKKDYFDFEEIIGSLLGKETGVETRLNPLQEHYQNIVDRHRQYKPTTVSHNDAKWDNWFHGKILGDFGSASIGREYKDLARVLIDPEEDFSFALNEENVRSAVDSYLAIRRQVDSEFRENPNEFRKNVYEMLFVESLRIASYKAQTQSANLVGGLLGVAEKYANLTRQTLVAAA